MATIAYGLRAEFQGTIDDDGEGRRPKFLGGVIRLDSDRELNVGDALAAHDGAIPVDDGDHLAIAALDGYPALKRLPARVAKELEPIVGEYDGRKVGVLRRECIRRGLPADGVKADLVARLVANDREVAGGPPTPLAGRVDPNDAATPDPDPGDDAGDANPDDGQDS